MILKQYGTTYQSVQLDFDSKAITEVGFRRDRAHSIPADRFSTHYEPVETHELVAEAEGDVQDETEQRLLEDLEGQVRAILAALGPGEVVVVRNEAGHDHPKTRQKMTTVVVDGETRLRFHYSIQPALRVTRFRPRP